MGGISIYTFIIIYITHISHMFEQVLSLSHLMDSQLTSIINLSFSSFCF